MTNIFSIFEEKSLLPLIKAFPELNDMDTLVWYPSSGYDYRHIASDLTTEKDNKKIYLHTDISALNYNYDSLKDENPLFKRNKFIAQYKTIITCLDFFELKLKTNNYYPCYDVLYKGIDDKGKYNGRVFCFLIKLGATENKVVPLIYAGFENTNFFYDYLLESNIDVTELVHINDGGQSMGSSKLKMDYIYLYLNKIGVQKIKLDYSIETKIQHAISDFGHFHYFNPINRSNKIVERNLDLFSRQFIQTEIDKWIDINEFNRTQLKYELEKVIGTEVYKKKREQHQYDYFYIRR